MFYSNIIHEGFSPSELYLDKTSTAHISKAKHVYTGKYNYSTLYGLKRVLSLGFVSLVL